MTTTETDPRILAAFTDWRLARIRAEVTYLEVLRAYYQDHAAGFDSGHAGGVVGEDGDRASRR